MQEEQRKQKIIAIMRQYQQDKDTLEQSFKNLSQINYAKTLKQITKLYPDIIHKIPDDLQNLPLTIQASQSLYNTDFLPRSNNKESSMNDLDQYQQYYQAKQEPQDKFAAKKSSKKEGKSEVKIRKQKKKSANQQPEFYRDLAQDNQVDCCICFQQQGYLICCDACAQYYHPQCLGLKKLPTIVWYCDKQCRKFKL